LSVQDYISAPSEPVVAAPRTPGSLADGEAWLWRIMLAPAILYIVVLVGVPFFLSLYYSVSDVTVPTFRMSRNQFRVNFRLPRQAKCVL